MIREQLYHKTVQILYDAYMNDTLVHGSCAACAVGNMVAANCGYQITHDRYNWLGVPTEWVIVFMTVDGEQLANPENYRSNSAAKYQIDSTGYAWQELAKIEYAFETADMGNNGEDYMFNGLVAVLEVLKDIHQVTDEDLLTTNTNRFRAHYNRSVLV